MRDRASSWANAQENRETGDKLANDHPSSTKNTPSLRAPLTDLAAWLDQLSYSPLPSQHFPSPIKDWFGSLSPTDKDLVEAIGEAVWSLTDEEKQILYSSCSSAERRMIGVCCLIYEDAP
jgi:hypothetical protein